MQSHLAEARRLQKYSREMNGGSSTEAPQSAESGDFDETDDDFLEPTDDEEDDDDLDSDHFEEKKSSEAVVSNESHNHILDESFEKVLESEEASLNTRPGFLTLLEKKQLDQSADISLVTGKAARLADDCSNAEVRGPCTATRKWRCVFVNGRWRRHKCKYESEINVTPPKMSTKKCACFTPSGLVYTRLETDGTIARRPAEATKDNNTRSRRSIDNDVFEPNTVDSILKENPSIGHLSSKNEPINELENRNLKDKIDKLIQETEAFLEAYERTKDKIVKTRIKRKAQGWSNRYKQRNEAIVNGNDTSLECKIERDGTVNCSQVIYKDLKAWHTNRLSLEDQIRQLKTKLEDLKEIKRHLKTTKPATNSNIVETIPIQSTLTNNQLHNTSEVPTQNSSKEYFRKGRLHRVKSKHRNGTNLDKKFRQSNEYVIPTINANTKDDIFDSQLRNDTIPEVFSTNQMNMTDEGYATKDSLILDTILPKPQVTTIIIDRNTYDRTDLTLEEIGSHSVATTTDVTTSTETIQEFEFSTAKHVAPTDHSTEHLPVDFSQTIHNFTSAIDKFLSSELPMIGKTETTSILPATEIISTVSPVANLGPARLDASEYEQRNPNKGVSIDMGSSNIFNKPRDDFQRRLHPLFIENEDKHVCYCEENRRMRGLGHSYIEAAHKAREESRRLKEQRLRKKLRKAKKKAELERLCESERMNCFRHDNYHWRTAPLWTAGPFCFCMSASNNTYNCVRTINATHNLLYCEFVTGLITYYNLRIGLTDDRRRFDDNQMFRGESVPYNERAWRWSGYGRRYARARALHRRRHMSSY
ncbi:hypothetical protein MSG28_000479 [Choristoneura fumiferana]|uniref:Uncharacterized protein n=1 Tax=Choristoneura fumiferana TaxID=7141 RepID=A0ACC0K0P2_CHOFU|nr:hypothetical protein MSG28_000479 [Choristoneura fumiferana]